MDESMKRLLKRIWGLAVVAAVFGVAAAGLKPERRDGAETDEPPTSPVWFSLKDWKRALAAIKKAFATKNLGILAAGVAYFSTLAFFPLMAAAVAIAALVITPEQLQSVAATADAYLPKDVANLISTQLETLSERKADSLVAAGIAIALSLFGASGASKSLVSAADVAYGVREPHGWLKQQMRGLGWTVVGIIFGFLIAALLVINDTVLHQIGIMSPLAEVLLYSRWALLVLLITFGLAVFYRYGPNRAHPHWQWVTWGSLTATILWLAGTSLFFIYVQNIGNYDQSYSLFAGIIVLMIWFNLSAFTVLLSAAVNHALEKAASQAK
jgi:membrane protein